MVSPSLILGYDAAVLSVRSRILAYVQFLWTNSPSLRDADVDRLVARIVPVVRSGQLQVAQLTDAYIGRMSQAAGISWTAGVNRALVDYRGVPFDVVYKRPAVTAYSSLTAGSTFAVAKKAGLDRLSSIVTTDIQQTRNRQAQQSMGRSGFSLFRRQLSGSENCALCSIASTQRYTRGDLMPIHPGCDCAVVPLNSPNDPGQVIDGDRLETIHAEVERFVGEADRGGRAPDYRKLIVSREHGELGPTLTWLDDSFTGPDDLGRPAVM
jgi:hypothetical protein